MSINITLFAQMVAFLLLIWFVNKYLWGPVSSMLAERQKSISDGLAAAEQGRKSLDEAEQQVKAELDKAKQEAAELVAQARSRASAIEDEARQKAQTEAAQIKAAAEAEVEQVVMRAKEQLRKQIAEITVAGAGKILRQQVDAKAHSALLDEMAAQL